MKITFSKVRNNDRITKNLAFSNENFWLKNPLGSWRELKTDGELAQALVELLFMDDLAGINSLLKRGASPLLLGEYIAVQIGHRLRTTILEIPGVADHIRWCPDCPDWLSREMNDYTPGKIVKDLLDRIK